MIQRCDFKLRTAMYGVFILCKTVYIINYFSLLLALALPLRYHIDMSSRDYFKGKRIAVIGLGPHGEMVPDIKYLIKGGALVSIYDLRSEARLKTHLVFLRSIGLANYVCGSIPREDLEDMDLIILSHEYPRDSVFLKGLDGKKIQIEYPETLFFKLAPPVTVVGIMGKCGKSTVMSVLSPMLDLAISKNFPDQNFFSANPESDEGVLSHLKKMKSGDVLLLRLTDILMKELYALRISPHVSIFTSIPQVGSYNNFPFEILSYQTYNNFIIGSDEVIDATHELKLQSRAKMLRTKSSFIPSDWKLGGRGEHDRENAAMALQAARLFKINDEGAREILEKWKPLKGRMEQVKKINSVEFYNDSASVSSYSTMVALKCLSSDKNTVLIFGGSDTLNNYKELYSLFPQYVHTLVLIPGSGTLRERVFLEGIEGVKICSTPSIEEAVRVSLESAKKGDKVIFSPGFDAAGFDRSRMERGERFVRAVRSL